MALTGTRTYVGFGFGAIQAGLLLNEAFQSGAFRQLVVAEVLPEVVASIRKAGGLFSVNVAHADRIEHVKIGPVGIENPGVEADRHRLIAAIAEAEELGTAVPSVSFYVSPGPGSLHHILAEGFRRKARTGGPRAVVYAAENHNHAAEILEAQVRDEIPEGERSAVNAQVRFVNTVIGKMSGVITDPAEVRTEGLATIATGDRRAFLVEGFNRILISAVRFADGAPFRRGIRVFEERDDLLPFEEAKLYGHNATHALAAYVGAVQDAERIADLAESPGCLPFLRAAFVEESGAALIRKHAGVDTLFTPEGYRRYAEDLLERMMNPHLQDKVERVGRDPARKLGWNDRLIGTMRLVMRQGIEPRRYAFGAAAALARLDRTILDSPSFKSPVLPSLWHEAAPEAEEQATVLDLVEKACQRLRMWRAAGFPNLEGFLQGQGCSR